MSSFLSKHSSSSSREVPCLVVYLSLYWWADLHSHRRVHSRHVHMPSWAMMRTRSIRPCQQILSPSSPSILQMDNYPPIFTFKNNRNAPSEVPGFHASLFTSIGLWLALDQIATLQHPYRNIDQAGSGELDDSFCCHSLNNICSLICVTAISLVIEPFDPFGLLTESIKRQSW